MKAVAAVGCSLLFTVVDVTLTTLLYIRGVHIERFFDVYGSVVDLWAASLVRSSLLMGAAIGVSKNTTEGPKRVKDLETFTIVMCLLTGMYSVIKLLLYSEVMESLSDPWFLCLVAWTCISALATFLTWKLLSLVQPVRETTLGINSEAASPEETESLLDSEEDSSKGAKKDTASPATIGRLLSYSKHDAALLGLAFLFLIVAAVGETFIPYYTGLAVDAIVIQKDMEAFSKSMIIISVFAIVSSFAAGVRGGVFSLALARLNVRIRNLLFRSLVRQEIGFFDANHTGDITSRLTSDTTMVSDLISLNMNICLRSLVKGVGVCVFMFTLSWKLSLITFMGFPFVMLVSKLYGKYYKRLAREVQDALAKANNIAEETVSAMKMVRSFANEEAEAGVYWEKLQHMYKLNRKQALAYACYMWSSSLTVLALQVSILYYGGHLVVSGHLTSGNLISFIIYELELGDCMENIGAVYTGLMQGVGAAEKVFEFIDRKPQLSSDGTLAPDTLKGLVEFKNVTFSYPTRPETQVLKDVSFTLHPGQVTALVGPSGSGKSSCVSLLEHFYRAQAGQVLLDGTPIEEYDHRYLHTKVSLVGQEPVLFARSVQENIAYGLTDCSLEEIVQASMKANAHGFITELPDGYSTDAGEKGAQLSGGQKQRVAIARALVRSPHVLILDEATSALDAESEHIVQQALNGIMQDRSVLVIAHRLSTVEKAHNIIVIDKGEVLEQGTHRDLMQKEGLYSKLVKRQILGIETGTETMNRVTSNPPNTLRKQRESKRKSTESGEEFHV
ncbi:LOW QUALITY PROTEIN: ABC-type oligopeptide transporter ABCB9 [Acipenser ruthenus]|uniref:LOW QUALITY PROTEIN: ABC-type oligopeptide transporter ABCB9 n=1 Tax=Acipenser ruthenus TaxID=7906 RepID=UPI0027412315|nr:LOW QUALITY PROTEIN: ABC-type oligopeptide transporter ABCB9 [Acipenser ruthenus]